MFCLHDRQLPLHLEQMFPMAYPWNSTVREDVPRFENHNGWWRNPAAFESGKALLSCVGDLICEPRLTRAHRYGDSVFFHPLFQFVRPILRQSDFVVGNLETTVTTLTPDAGQFHTVAGKYHCNTTESFLDALRYAGFDGVVNANNHVCDSGALGLLETNRLLDRHGFLHTGTFSPEDSQRAALVNINGIRLGIISYATYFNRQEGNFTPAGQAMLNPFTPEKAQKDVAWAKEKGAEFILCYIHWGKEYQHYPTDLQKEQAQQLADAGVDYIVGSHSHCLQVNDRITASDGRTVPVVYSMGNFHTNESKDLCRHSGILQLLLEKTPAGIQIKDWFVPCYIFDAFESARYSPVPADSLRNGGFDHPELARSRQFSQALIDLPQPVSGAITAEELCKLWGIPQCDFDFTVSGICTNAPHVLDRQLYFALGERTQYETLCLRRRSPVLVVATEPHPEQPTLVVPDVKRAYHQLMVHLRGRFANKFLTVAGGENKTVTAELLTRTLEQVCRVHSGTADHSWLLAHPSQEWCVQELRSNPLGYPALAPDICVITAYSQDLPQLLETLTDSTVVFYNGEDPQLHSLLEGLPNTKAFAPTPFPGMRMESAAGAAAAVAKHLSITPLENHRYSGMEQNIFDVNGITVLTDYACKSETSARAALLQLARHPGKTIAVMENCYTACAEAVIHVPQPSPDRQERQEAELALEKELLSHLEPGCAVLLCGGRHLALNLTLRRVFGLTDGDIYDLT